MSAESNEMNARSDFSAKIAEIAAELDLLHIATGSDSEPTDGKVYPGPESVVVAARLKQLEEMDSDEKDREAQEIRAFYSRDGREFRKYGRQTQIKRAAMQLAKALHSQTQR